MRYLIASVLILVTLTAGAATLSKWKGITIGRSTTGQIAQLNGKRFGNTSTGMLARIEGFRTLSGSAGSPLPTTPVITATGGDTTVSIALSSGTDTGALTNILYWDTVTRSDYSLYANSISNATLIAAGFPGTSYVHTGRTNGTTYYYRLRGTDVAGSTQSAEVSAAAAAVYSITLNVVTGTPSGEILINGVAIESVPGYTTSGVASGCQGKLVLSNKSALGVTISGGGGGAGTNDEVGGYGGGAAFITNMMTVPVFDGAKSWSNSGSVYAVGTGGGGGDDVDQNGVGGPGDSFGDIIGGGGGDGGKGDDGLTGKVGFTGGTTSTGISGKSGEYGGYNGGAGGLINGASYSLTSNITFFVGTIYTQDGGASGIHDGTEGYVKLLTTP